MKYYVLKKVNDEKVVGVVPQTEGMVAGYDRDADNSVSRMEPYRIPNFLPNIDAIKLSNKAKLVDWLSDPLTGPGLLVSDNFRMILSEHNLCIHEFYDVILAYKGKRISNYSYMKLGETLEETGCIVFALTQYVLKPSPWLHEAPEVLSISDVSELWDYKKKQVSEKPFFNLLPQGDLVVNEKFDINCDLFFLRSGNFFVVSEKLKLAIQENKLVGIAFQEISELGFTIKIKKRTT